MQHTKQSVTRSCRNHVTTVGSAVFERPACESSPTRQRIMVPVRHLAIAGRCHTFASQSWLWHSHQGAPRARGLLILIREAHAKDRKYQPKRSSITSARNHAPYPSKSSSPSQPSRCFPSLQCLLVNRSCPLVYLSCHQPTTCSERPNTSTSLRTGALPWKVRFPLDQLSTRLSLAPLDSLVTVFLEQYTHSDHLTYS